MGSGWATLAGMTATRIRPMTSADVEPASQAILADDWGDRRSWFEYVVGSRTAHGLVAEAADGSIVGSGVAAIHGPVAWIGTIWVRREARGRGIGAALTQATLDAADAAGCATQVLVATDAGRPLYERLGFEVQTWYRTMEARGRTGPPPPSVRPFRRDNLPAMLELDREATGEDRREALVTFATPESTRVLVGDDHQPRGFVIRAPWGGGATVARGPEEAMTILRARLVAAGPDRTVRCGIVLDNEAGAAALEADGWTEAWRAPRLIRGAPMHWDPTMLWGQFNHAMG
jgi:GNAT superfamily N-acetyltransferase